MTERDEFLARLVAVAAPAGKRRLPCHAGLFTLEPAALHVTAVKKAEDRNTLVVRFVNMGRKSVTARLTLGCDIRAAWLLRLDEQRRHSVAVSKRRTVNQACRSREIVTLELALSLRNLRDELPQRRAVVPAGRSAD